MESELCPATVYVSPVADWGRRMYRRPVFASQFSTTFPQQSQHSSKGVPLVRLTVPPGTVRFLKRASCRDFPLGEERARNKLIAPHRASGDSDTERDRRHDVDESTIPLYRYFYRSFTATTSKSCLSMFC